MAKSKKDGKRSYNAEEYWEARYAHELADGGGKKWRPAAETSKKRKRGVSNTILAEAADDDVTDEW